ncbi:von Willebrand factor type A domain-containing protein [Auriculariales sp. MPI-PUGE-AT-0066]|nr:von Willebrand factor type A domain-containing protein [Auriculariales sp. MPI-PUGE-AT-0066]
MPHCGISAHGDQNSATNFPLVKVKVNYDVVDVHVHASVTHTYLSASNTAQDVVYTFPLPAGAAVCGFSAVVDGQVVRGVVKAKDEAKQAYDDAIAEGKTAALLTENRSEVFQTSVGNVKPGGSIQVHIEFVLTISNDAEKDSLRLVVPLTVAPYYGGPGGRSTATTNVIPEISMSFQMADKIMSIGSSTHLMVVRLGSVTDSNAFAEQNTSKQCRAFARLTCGGLLKNDIVVTVLVAGLDAPRAMLEYNTFTKSTAYALTLVPRFVVPALPRQRYLFLIDRSGSMQGPRMTNTQTAMQHVLRSLPSRGTSFNIVSFGSRVDSLWPAKVAGGVKEYDKASCREASAFVGKIQANYGGTEVRMALEFALAMCTIDHAEDPTAIILLTDGEAWDIQGVVDSVSNAVQVAQGSVRVFVLGIGEQVSKAMCDGIAAAGNGVASYVGNLESPAEKLVGLLHAARVPPVRDLSVQWEAEPTEEEDYDMMDDARHSDNVGVDAETLAEMATTAMPPMLESQPTQVAYAGFRFNIYSIFRETTGVPAARELVVNGIAGGQPVELRVPITVVNGSAQDGEQSKAGHIHATAARAIMQSLELKGTPEALAQVVQLGVKYELASSQTSFVAILETSDKTVSVLPRAENIQAASTGQGGNFYAASISGRGLGGRGLGKGGAKRHRKILRDNVQGITKPAIGRLARRGGVKRASGLIYEASFQIELKMLFVDIHRRRLGLSSSCSLRTSSATP